MIDRSQPLFVLRPKTMATAVGGSLALLLAVPLIAALLLLAGGIALVVLSGGNIALSVLGAIVFLGGLAVLISTQSKGKGAGFGLLLLGAIMLWIGVASKTWLSAAALSAFAAFNDAGACLLRSGFYGTGAYRWALIPLILALLAAAGLLVTIGLMRCERLVASSASKGGRRCPSCQQVRFHFQCPACERLLTDLQPSIHGIFSARCTCGRKVPTMELVGRRSLRSSALIRFVRRA